MTILALFSRCLRADNGDVALLFDAAEFPIAREARSFFMRME